MGFIRRDFGQFCIETRHESFIVHSSLVDPHPEFLYRDLPDLIAALQDAYEAEADRVAEQGSTA